jgi:hypothetical protein
VREGAEQRSWLIALLLGLPLLVLQWTAPAPRLDADAVEYYAHLRSIYYDHDVQFQNEFEHFGILSRWDKAQPTETGYRRTNFSVGPALLWLPFYAAADGWARLAGAAQDGYSDLHIRAVCFASLAYGLLGVLLVHRILRPRVSTTAAFWAVFLLLYGTFLFWYLAYEPVMSHASSFFLAAAILVLWLERGDSLSPGRAALLGLTLGLATCVRWQNALLLLIPGLGLLGDALGGAPEPERARIRRALVATAVLMGAFLLAVLPQLVVFKSIFGTYLLPYPVQGRDYLRLDRPALLETFFSSRHGLLFWTPLLWAGFLGLPVLLRRERRSAPALLIALALMSYVNACSEDWWAGGSFSNRRFDSVLPILALGLATSLEWLRLQVSRRPGAVAAVAGLVLAGWNVLFMEQYRRNAIPRDEPVSFARVAQNNADLLAEMAGSPLAWPANWVFALRHRLPPDRYDLAVGKYLFLRQNNLGGVIDLGDDRADPALLAEGWTSRRPCEGAVCRGIASRARVLAPLSGDAPGPLDVTVRAAGSGTLALSVNDRPVGEFPLQPTLSDLTVRVPAAYWRPQLNELVLAAGEAWVDRLVFTRSGRSSP